MCARQREFRGTVIEGGRFPDRRCMACLASMTESCRHVIGIRRNRKICGMARVAVRVRQFIVAVDVARLTGRRDMCARQREFRRTVIEGGWLPDSRRMACLTSVAEGCRHVIGIRWYCEIRRMTSVAIGVCKLVVSVCVT